MKRLNVTLVVEEDLLREARAVAARRHTSVNEMVRDYLRQVVGEERRRSAAFDRIRHLLDKPSVELGAPPPSRDSLHER
jgi:plasmid stability protein